MGTRRGAREQNPASLKEGAKVGPWRVVSWKGQGAYGVVYRVVREGHKEEGPFALKLALRPRDARFVLEVELLTRLDHPNVPRFYDAGAWECAQGLFPYVVMEWVEGAGLYEWAQQHNPTSRQALELLAQVASALVATHEAKAVHRDVKGDNVLVRRADGRPYLMDFGSGAVDGGPELTRDVLAPGTAAYRSPEAWAYERLLRFHPKAHYGGSIKDDLFALGVTAYRLVTDEYPPPTHPAEEGSEVWWMGRAPRPPRALNPRVCVELDEIISRLLSVLPGKRFNCSSRETAEALERAARSAGPEADEPLFAWETRPAAEQGQGGPRPGPRPRYRDPKAVRRAQERVAAEHVELERREKGGASPARGRLLLVSAPLVLLVP